jgi:hypothetical protein
MPENNIANGGERRVFLLSPANSGGKRARMLVRRAAAFPLALQLRDSGAPLADVFTFMSGLYFRGKVAYTRAFANPPTGVAGGMVITTSRGLVPMDEVVSIEDIEEFARVPIGVGSEPYRSALERTSCELSGRLDACADEAVVVLLGSIATGKYIDLLADVFGPRLRFPAEFIGRGDMSRGGLMLRCADDARELDYVPFDGRVRHGPRPPKLEPLRRGRAVRR